MTELADELAVTTALGEDATTPASERCTVKPHFVVQARLIQRHRGAVIRDETRRGTALLLDDALREAGAHVADGFTAWVFRVEPGAGVAPTYAAVQVLRPDPPSVPARPEEKSCEAPTTPQPVEGLLSGQGIAVPARVRRLEAKTEVPNMHGEMTQCSGDGLGEFELDVKIVEFGPVAAALLGNTDDGCDTRKDGDC